MGEPDYAEYLSGIIQAYEHITEKFSYERSWQNPEILVQ
jgi:hypothetical protein